MPPYAKLMTCCFLRCVECSVMLARNSSVGKSSLPKSFLDARAAHSHRGNIALEVSLKVSHQNRACAPHKLSVCPVCHSNEYVKRRVQNVVHSALKRLAIKKTMRVLDYLGAESWKQVLSYLENKRTEWNKQYPESRMTLTNIALDHIKPVNSFKNSGVSAQMLLCNHYTNLQPLLIHDNSWKADSWSEADERYWESNIIMQPNYRQVYYPKHTAQPSLLEDNL